MATWTKKTNNINSYDADHINDLQDEKLDRDGQVPATGVQQWDKGADVASAATLALGNDGNYFDVTGTTGITAITQAAVGAAAVQAGTVVRLHFDGILTLTHHATDLILPGGTNITTAAGDEAEFINYDGADHWRCFNYSPPVAAVPAGVIPIGGIIMWSGTIAAIPADWALCSGASGTPDLRDKFIVGAGQDDAGIAKTNVSGSLTVSGGSATHPAHADHSISAHAGCAVASHETSSKGNAGGDVMVPITATHSVTQASAHSDLVHDTPSILNPYYALAFIMRIA
jgi:hypothetical protein